MDYLFSFQGRINRAKLWLFVLIAIGTWIAYAILFGVLVGFSAFSAQQAQNGSGLAALGGGLLILGLVGCVLYIALFIASLALSTKRLHDRNKGAVWLVPFIILPAVLNIYVIVATLSGGFDPQHIAAMNANPAIMVFRLIAVVLSIWAFVELYCLRGTIGDNRFGPDPLNPLMSVERTF